MAIETLPKSHAFMMNEAQKKFHMTGGKSFRQFPWCELRWMTTHTDWSRSWGQYSRSGSYDGMTGVWQYPLVDPPQVDATPAVKAFFELGKPTLHTVYRNTGEEVAVFKSRVQNLSSMFGGTSGVYYHPSDEDPTVAAFVSDGDGSREVLGSSYCAISHGIYDSYPFSDGVWAALSNLGATDSVVLLAYSGEPTPTWDSLFSVFECSFPVVVDCLVGYNTTSGEPFTYFRPFSSSAVGTISIPYTQWVLAKDSQLPTTATDAHGTTVEQGAFILGSSGSGMQFTSTTTITGVYNDKGRVEEV